MGRKVLGVITGWIIGVAIILIFEMIASAFNPQPPRNLMRLTPEETAAYVRTIPIGYYLTVLFGYMLGSLAGGWMATKVSKQRNNPVLPLIVGVLIMAGGLMYLFNILPGQPIWFSVLSLLTFVPLALVGHRIAK